MSTSAFQLSPSYAKVLAALREQSVVHAVAGGVAVNLHGLQRPTLDLDLLVGLEPDNLYLFVRTMQSLGYEPRLPVPARFLLNPEMREDWIANKNMLAFSFWHPEEPTVCVDFLLAHSRQEELLRGAVNIKHNGTPVRVVSVFHLIDMKRSSDRSQDQDDVAKLVEEFIALINRPLPARSALRHS